MTKFDLPDSIGGQRVQIIGNFRMLSKAAFASHAGAKQKVLYTPTMMSHTSESRDGSTQPKFTYVDQQTNPVFCQPDCAQTGPTAS
jgi:hypothetical protein